MTTEAAYAGLVSPAARLLVGPGFALLRPAFAELRLRARIRAQPVRRLLVFMGGADAANATGQILEARELPAVRSLECAVDVVVGSGHPHLHPLRDTCAKAGHHLHVDTDEMAVLMARADLAVGAAGSEAWERRASGCPLTSAVEEDSLRFSGSIYITDGELTRDNVRATAYHRVT